ncbi:MAG: phosphatase PAP2 family protein, partial [Rariglobus sp.]
MRRGGFLIIEWKTWWHASGAMSRAWPAVAAILFLGAHAVLGGLRSDHALIALAALALSYAGPRLRPAAGFLLPLLIMVVVYDAQQYWAGAWRAPVHVAEPHAWELSWFGVEAAGSVITPAAWWQTHTHGLLDFVCGVAYLAFVPVFMATAAWWRFVRKIHGAEKVMWAMLWLNLAAYVTWLIYPAAPPWYVDRHGLGPAVLSALPEAGGAARFDALLGVTWFADYYGRNANVFGAIPSLHVGQTFLAVLFAWRFRSLRVLTTAFWLLVFFSSVYLNHHYIVDGLAGVALATMAWLAVRSGPQVANTRVLGQPTIVTAASAGYWRCLYQFLSGLERRGLHLGHRVVVWDLGLDSGKRRRLEKRFSWAVFEALDFSALPAHVVPECRTYAWKPVVMHRTMDRWGGRLVWFDSAALIHRPWDELVVSLDAHGLYALTGQSALRVRCDEEVQRLLAVSPEILDQPEFVAGLLGFDTDKPRVRALLDEWQRLALDPRFCPPQHARHNPEQALLTILIRQGEATKALTINTGEIDISSPYPVRWVSSR